MCVNCEIQREKEQEKFCFKSKCRSELLITNMHIIYCLATNGSIYITIIIVGFSGLISTIQYKREKILIM